MLLGKTPQKIIGNSMQIGTGINESCYKVQVRIEVLVTWVYLLEI